jgi:hypothetical protein
VNTFIAGVNRGLQQRLAGVDPLKHGSDLGSQFLRVLVAGGQGALNLLGDPVLKVLLRQAGFPASPQPVHRVCKNSGQDTATDRGQHAQTSDGRGAGDPDTDKQRAEGARAQ